MGTALSLPDAVGTGRSIILYSKMWRSGTGLYAQGLARGLAEAGADVTFIAPRGEPDDVADGVARRITPPREHVAPFRLGRARRAARSFRRVGTGLLALVRQRLRGPRIVVSIPEPLPFWLPALLLLRLTRAQVVFVCHDPEPHAWRLPAALRPLERAALHANYRLAWRLVTLSDASRAALIERFGVGPERVTVVPHGAFDAAWAGPLKGDGRLLLFGSLRRNKQVHLAIRAAAALSRAGGRVRLTVAGAVDPDDPAYAGECEAAARGAGPAVDLRIGYVSETQVARLFEEADAVLLPYVDFASQSGVAVLAGMAGRPVICAATGGIPDLIAQGLAATVIAPPVGETEIATAMSDFLRVDAQEWTARAMHGRERLAQALAWRVVGERLQQVFA